MRSSAHGAVELLPEILPYGIGYFSTRTSERRSSALDPCDALDKCIGYDRDDPLGLADLRRFPAL